MMIPHLFVAGVILVGALRYEPTLLTIKFADGVPDQVIAATSPETCAAAQQALLSGRWQIDGAQIASVTCAPGNGFSARSQCIAGHNCGRAP